jgi:hypothetical protein
VLLIAAATIPVVEIKSRVPFSPEKLPVVTFYFQVKTTLSSLLTRAIDVEVLITFLILESMSSLTIVLDFHFCFDFF